MRTVIIHWIELQSATRLSIPLIFWVSEIDDVGHTPRADYIIMANQVPSMHVTIRGAIGFVNECALRKASDLQCAHTLS